MKLVAAAALLGSLVIGASATQAMPLAPASDGTTAPIIKVAGGCGPGWHRGPYGGCRPNRGPVVVAPGPGPVVVAPGPRCPPGFFWRWGRCHPL
jgi:hypothetical protein